MRIADVDLEACERGNVLMRGHLATLVPGESLANLDGDVAVWADQRVAALGQGPGIVA
jgi:hypothetical protein